MTSPRQIRQQYEQGVNITRFLREEQGLSENTAEIIELAYDVQAGSYVEAMRDPRMAEHKSAYGAELARLVHEHGEPLSLLEAGVGEATTFAEVMQHMGPKVRAYGFDISWSRIRAARAWMKEQGSPFTTLCTGDMFHIPFADSSIDVVYTSHSIEPNGGHERELLRELYRVTRGLLILLEPGYELAGEEARARMRSHGYCRGLPETARALGYEVVCHEPFPFSWNPLNPTALTMIRKDAAIAQPPEDPLACPVYGTSLIPFPGGYFSPEALRAYPTILDIPCLRVENGILASHLDPSSSSTQGPGR